jgi:hypothetical protein
MARKQDIEDGTAFNLSGNVPAGHALAPIRAKLLDDPRERQWVIGQVVSKTTTTDHPADADDRKAPTMQFVDIGAVVSQADCDQLAAMLTRLHSAQPGQASLAEVPPPASAG